MRTISFISFYRERCPGDLQWWADGPLIYSSLFNSQYICCIRQYCMPLTFSLLTHAVCAFSYVLLFCVLLCFCAFVQVPLDLKLHVFFFGCRPRQPVQCLLFTCCLLLHLLFSTHSLNWTAECTVAQKAQEWWILLTVKSSLSMLESMGSRTDCRKISFILPFGTITLRRTWKKKNWTYKLCREFILFNVLHLCWAYL